MHAIAVERPLECVSQFRFFPEHLSGEFINALREQYQAVITKFRCYESIPTVHELLNVDGDYNEDCPFYYLICDRVAEQLCEENPGRYPDPSTYYMQEEYNGAVHGVVYACWNEIEKHVVHDIEVALIYLQMSFLQDDDIVNSPIVGVW